jgi:predicted O-methyltransferase YrrM
MGQGLKEITPWFAQSSLPTLRLFLKQEMLVFEWGMGRSTIWFAANASKTISVDHNIEWVDKTQTLIVKYVLLDKVELVHEPRLVRGTSDEYSRTILRYDRVFDVVSVDGRNRNMCISCAVGKLKPGGLLILDDSSRSEYANGIKLLNGWRRRNFFDSLGEKHSTSMFWKPKEKQ